MPVDPELLRIDAAIERAAAQIGKLQQQVKRLKRERSLRLKGMEREARSRTLTRTGPSPISY